MTPGSRFSGLIRSEDQPDGRFDVLLEPLTYRTADGQWAIVAPAGFTTDYASIPRLLWAIIPQQGKYNRAAVIHDVLYQTAPIDPRTGRPCSRAAADAIMREACAHLGVRLTQRWAMWIGLRLGGWIVWARYRRRQRRLTHSTS